METPDQIRKRIDRLKVVETKLWTACFVAMKSKDMELARQVDRLWRQVQGALWALEWVDSRIFWPREFSAAKAGRLLKECELTGECRQSSASAA